MGRMWLELRGGGWRSGPVLLAVGFRQRWRGLRPYPGSGLLMAVSSVHGLGLRSPITVAGLSGSGRVIEVDTLAPGGWSWISGARWLLELPPDRPAPPPGLTLDAYALS
ncbi:MAG: hypothetical protein ACE5MI_07235 [Acidimicrobiia bacterium]